MSSNRDHLFPATSIGRSQGSRFPTQRVTSGDSSAHPLLSSTSISSRPSSPALFESNDLPGGSPKYVPYTPRQRVSTTAVTTGTAHPPSPQHPPGQGDATSKLQLLQLKSAAQHVGLDTASVGWAMLEKLVHESDHNDADWIEIWTAATLLLPLEHLSSSDKLTGDFVKDHVVLCDGPSRNNAPIVTLSGLRGTLNDQTLTFRSTLHPYSKIFQDLLSASTRSSALPLLPDLPNTTVSYPTFSVPSHAPSLPLPPRTHAQTAKPPLPPRPGGRSASNPSSSSRIANPFAALFGSSSSATLNQPKTSPVPIPSSPTASLRSLDSHSEHNTVEVAAFTISKKIVRKDVAKEMTKALKKAVKESLSTAFGETNGSANGNGGPGNGGQLPSWVIERVQEFTANWYPFVKDRERKKGSSALPSVSSGYHVAWIGESPEKMAENVQDFYLGLEQDLRVLGFGNEKGRHLNEEYDPYGYENDEKRVQEKIVSETKIKEAMEVVERTICSLFYDRMYCQPVSDDSSHDEALSSRVAALNMLDLGLEHLDIHTEDAGPELDAVVHACGEMLSQIDTCRSPGDKAAILVAAHKVIVDGLSRLPPIRLMTEEESKAQKARAAAMAKFNAIADAPPKEADGSLKIHLPPNSPDTSAPPSTGGTNAKQIKSPSAVGPLAPSPVRPTIPTIVEPEAEAPKEEEAPAEADDVQEQGSVKAPSPVLSISPAPASTPVSGDVLLPMIIFSVVKANPPRLVSNLLFTQRYRNQSIGGEESYCLINLMAVAEFLENVDLAALGLSNSDKVLSAADLTPIPLDRSPLVTDEPEVLPEGLPNSFRERVEQANKVITGVVDTSVGMLRSLLPVVPGPANQGPTIPAPMEEAAQSPQPRNSVKPGFGMLRRESGGFSMRSIRSMASNLPGAGRGRGGTGADEERGQQMVSVPRPGSVKSRASVIGEEEEEEESTDEDDGDDESSVSGSVGEGEEGEELGVGNEGAGVDARSIRSFESMMSASAKAKGKPIGERKSLSDRLAHMSSLAGRKQGSGATSGRTSLQPQAGTTSGLPDSPTNSSRPQSPAPPPTAVPTMSAPPLLRVAPPIPRFVECSAGDLRLSEVSELLRDYRRLVVAIKSVGGFEE